MSNNNDDDLKDIFRRAFEQNERRRQGGQEPEQGNQPPDETPPIQIPPLPDGWWRNRRLWFSAMFLILITSFSWIINTYTEWLWFRNLAFEAIWTTTFFARIVMFVVFFLIAMLFLFANYLFAARGAVRSSSSSFQPGKFSGFRITLGLIAVFLSFSMAGRAATLWEEILLFVNQVPAGTVDPIFGQDLSFYFFSLPIYSFLRDWLLQLVFFSIAGVIGIYVIHNLETVRTSRWRPLQQDPFRKHIAVLAAAMAFLIAVSHWLNRFNLLFNSSTADIVAGAGYTDLNVTARILVLNAALMLILAIVLLLNTRRANLRPVFLIATLWFLSLIILNGVVPALFERYIVLPNQLSRESTYLGHDIEFTREAYGLNDVEVREFGRVEPLEASDLTDNAAALTNIRLWDYRVLPDNYEQLQALRTYYQFADVDIDRYEIDGETRQVMLAARELDKSRLPNQSWENVSLEFTHGYGLVMNPVDRFTHDGQPEFLISDLPPTTAPGLELTRPQIYYGETTAPDDIVFVGSGREEFDYPSGAQNVRTTYEGQGGVPLGGTLRRAAYASHFGDINILLNSDITPETRVMYHRQIVDRVQQITPFLLLDQDPYIILADGRLVWMVDAYTVSYRNPYSQHFRPQSEKQLEFNGINYIRNAAKVTIDAYDGTVNYYMVDESDPITRTYDRVFPNLFKPLSEMPASIAAHIRYPETLFTIQTQLYLEYHMTDPNVFFNQEDLWEIPDETFKDDKSQQIEPYYVMFNLPGEAETEYLLIQPYTPRAKENMVAWIAARNDTPNYGELVAYVLPKQQVVDGPIQVEAQIDQSPDISQQLSLWDQGGSQAIRGNLIVIPLNNSFLYVEPLYLQSSGEGSRPELKRVIVASGGDVVMEDTLAGALAELVNARNLTIDSGTVSAENNSNNNNATQSAAVDGSVEALIEAANATFAAAQEAQQAGDWATYGNLLEQLESDLQALLEISSAEGE
ncbi:MAG: UPF0182 family protein [Candidatus Promineifilaceae bacterium]